MAYAVVLGSLLALALLGLSDPVRQWWASARARIAPSAVLVTAMAVPFLGSSTIGVAEEALGAANGIRLVRALVLLILLITSALGILRDTRALQYAGGAALWMLAYGGLAMASAMYSVSSFVSAWKGFEVFVLVLTGVYLAGLLRNTQDVESLLNTLWLVLLFLVLTALAGAALNPAEAFYRQLWGATVLSGVYPQINPNSLTEYSALLVVVCVVRLFRPCPRKRSLGTWVVLGLALTAMLLAHSRTSIFAAAAAILAVVFFSGRTTLFWASAATMSSVWFFSEAVSAYIRRGQPHELFTSMSGRTQFWETVWSRFLDSPIIGYGFYAAQRKLFGVSSIDNTYLEVLLGLGILGLTVFLIPIGLTALALIKTRPSRDQSSPEAQLWIQLLVLFLLLFVRSLTGPSFEVLHWNLVMFMVLIVSVSALSRLNGSTSRREISVPDRRASFQSSLMR
jgi:O-antigen ligase